MKCLPNTGELFPLLDTAVVAGGAERTGQRENAPALTGSGGFIAVHDGTAMPAAKGVFSHFESCCANMGQLLSGGAGQKLLPKNHR